MFHQDLRGVGSTVEQGDGFGASFAVGDLQGDGVDELVVGAPGESVGAIGGAGAINVLLGSRLGLVGGAVVHQDVPGIPGAAEPGDSFGQFLGAASSTGN
jgi:hypothetical protein